MVIIKKNDIIIKFLLTLKFSIFPNNLSFKFPDVEFFELFLEFEEFPALLLFLLLINNNTQINLKILFYLKIFAIYYKKCQTLKKY